MGCSCRLQGVKVGLWCYQSANVAMECPNEVLLAPAGRKSESVVL